MQTHTPAPVYQTLRGVKSETTAGLIYLISADTDGRLRCACPDFAYRGHLRDCKHIKASQPVVAECDACALYGNDPTCRHCAGTGIIQAAR